MPANIPLFISRKFRFWTFVSMGMLVFAHGYNLNFRYLQPATTVNEGLTINTFTQYFLANGLFRFFIPMLFAISGYLYALQDKQPYTERIKKRVRALLVPYLFWSAVGLLFTYILELWPYGRGIVLETDLMRFGADRVLVHDYRWYEVLIRWVLLPVPYQLWFLRVLFIYNLAYPALRWCVLKRSKIFFSIVILLWLASFGTLIIEAEGLLFFSLGIWLQKSDFDISTPNKWLRPLFWGFVFITVAVAKTVLAFKGFAIMGNSVFPVIYLMHKLTVLSGLVAAWYGSDAVAAWCMNKTWFVRLSVFSFIIYAAHAPLIAYAINMVFPLVVHISGYRLATYALLPTAIFLLCVVMGKLIKSISPEFYAVITGGRGV